MFQRSQVRRRNAHLTGGAIRRLLRLLVGELVSADGAERGRLRVDERGSRLRARATASGASHARRTEDDRGDRGSRSLHVTTNGTVATCCWPDPYDMVIVMLYVPGERFPTETWNAK